jgi:thiosulfate dehydrogenase [quinone] large subunit
MTRAAFRQTGAFTSHEHAERVSVQRGRRSFLRGLMVLGVAGVLGLISWSALSQPQAQAPIYVSNPSAPNPSASNPSASAGNVLATAQSVPTDSSLLLNDPTWGPMLLLHLDNGQFVAYSDICTHAGCQVNFNPSDKLIECPCHGAVFDPYHGARVLAGPAPSPLTQIPIRYDQTSGNIYLQSS